MWWVCLCVVSVLSIIKCIVKMFVLLGILSMDGIFVCY